MPDEKQHLTASSINIQQSVSRFVYMSLAALNSQPLAQFRDGGQKLRKRLHHAIGLPALVYYTLAPYHATQSDSCSSRAYIRLCHVHNFLLHARQVETTLTNSFHGRGRFVVGGNSPLLLVAGTEVH